MPARRQQRRCRHRFLRQETAQQNIWQGDFPELVTSGVLTFSQDVAIGVASRMEPELLTILDKEIRFIGPNGIFDYTTFYEQKLDQRRSIQSLFYAIRSTSSRACCSCSLRCFSL